MQTLKSKIFRNCQRLVWLLYPVVWCCLNVRIFVICLRHGRDNARDVARVDRGRGIYRGGWSQAHLATSPEALDIPGPRIEGIDGIEHGIAWLRNRQSREVGKLAARRPEGLQFSRFRMIQICADYLLEKCVLQFKGFKCFKVWVQSFFESKSEVPIETDHFL